MKKSIDSYHSNKNEKRKAFYVASDGTLKSQTLDPSRRYFGMELELELDSDVKLYDSDECPDCGGNGYNECGTCGGELHDCPICGGYGFNTLDGVDHLCTHCNGVGVTECPDCHGTGRIECSTCAGTGHIVTDTESLFDVPEPYDQMVVYESDGSLSHGFEVITEPMTFNAIQKYIESDYMAKLLDYNRVTSNNGVHIHVSKVDDSHTKRVQMLLAQLSRKLASMTRDSRYARWYHGISGDSSDRARLFDSIPQDLDGHIPYYYAILSGDGRDFNNRGYMNDRLRDRYSCLNVGNNKTLEFRFFNTTKSADRLAKYINLVNSIMELADQAKPLGFYALADIIINPDWTLTATPSTRQFYMVKTFTPDITRLYTITSGRKVVDLLNTMASRSVILNAYERGDVVGLDYDTVRADYNISELSNQSYDRVFNASYGVIMQFYRKGSASGGLPFNPTQDIYTVDLFNSKGESLGTKAVPNQWIAGRVSVVKREPERNLVSC